jgi:micrococcal nuclease
LINKVRFDPPGNQLDREFVSIKNFGMAAIDLTGWTLRDNGGNVYTFPAATLAPGALLKLYSGSGANTATRLYWMSAGPIWNDTMDRALLTDASGLLRDRCAYRGGRWVLC